jgi:hypothetical protein
MARARTLQEGKVKEPPKKRRLTEFRGMFPATKLYIGVEATRQEIPRQLGEEFDRKIRKP